VQEGYNSYTDAWIETPQLLLDNLMTFSSKTMASNGRQSWKGFGGRGHGLIEALSRQLPGQTEETHEERLDST
jgi:hypothetical protein